MLRSSVGVDIHFSVEPRVAFDIPTRVTSIMQFADVLVLYCERRVCMAAGLSRVTAEAQTKQFATRAAVISDSHPSGITNAVTNSTAWDVLNDPEGLKIIIAHVHSKYGRD